MHRRDVLKGGLAGAALAALPQRLLAQPEQGWRSFSLTTRMVIAKPAGVTHAWAPIPSTIDAGWAKADEPRISSNGTVSVMTDAASGARFVAATWPSGTAEPTLEIVSTIMTRDRTPPLSSASATMLDPSERRRALRPTELIPLDGIVASTAATITAGEPNDLSKARAIYEWVVENTFRDPKTRGCGTGDVAAMLQSGNLGGKCADINALYVGLARAAGLPARDVYGIRVAPSRQGYKSLGAATEVITKSQHCRAEVWIEGLGWLPVDPADVRKVALEEPPGGLPLTAEPVARQRAALFGSWEMNWAPFNTAHDLALPGAAGPTIPFLMYPVAETQDGLLDSLDPEAFRYAITSRELLT